MTVWTVLLADCLDTSVLAAHHWAVAVAAEEVVVVVMKRVTVVCP